MTEPVPFTPRIGRFEMRRFLGRGAMGDVYLANDPEQEEEVALKFIRLSLADPDVLEAERRGAELQKRVAVMAPPVAAVHEYGEADGVFYVSMEFVDGTDLSTALETQRPFPPARAVDIGKQLAEVLATLHGFSTEIDGKQITSIIHGDIKPDNVRLQEDDHVRILDFGVAKHLSLTRKATRNLFGSYPYTPPERLITGLVDERSDLWALGIILYRLCSPGEPYPGTTPEELEHQIRSSPPLPLPADCPPRLRALVERCLAFEPHRRYESAVEMATALETVLEEGHDDEAQTEQSGEIARFETERRSEATDESTRRSKVGVARPGRDGVAGPGPDGIARPGRDDLDATRRTEPQSSHAGEPALPPLPGVDATRRTVPPPLPATGSAGTGGVQRPPAAYHAGTGDHRGEPAGESAGKLQALSPWIGIAHDLWSRLPKRLRRWLVVLAIVFLFVQVLAQSSARRVVRELSSNAAPNVADALDRYQFAAGVRPFDIGLGRARAQLHVALLDDAERRIARFRGDTPTAVQTDWQRARQHLAAALRIQPRDDHARARLLYCQAQLDRIEARSLTEEGKRQQAQRNWDDAVFGFERAASLDATWPDPYIGLARIYSYEQPDLEALEAAIQGALSRGYPPGARERAQVADVHSTLGARALKEAEALRGERSERRRLLEAQRHYELAAVGYEQILSYGRAKSNLQAAQRRIAEIRARLREIRRV